MQGACSFFPPTSAWMLDVSPGALPSVFVERRASGQAHPGVQATLFEGLEKRLQGAVGETLPCRFPSALEFKAFLDPLPH